MTAVPREDVVSSQSLAISLEPNNRIVIYLVDLAFLRE
jgi:hypothetical protein